MWTFIDVIRCGSRIVHSSHIRPYARRAFATETTATDTAAATAAEKLILTFTCPHQTILKEEAVEQVNLATADGDVGVLAKHVPSIFQLRPGLLEIVRASSSPKKIFFVSGGFATIFPDSSMQVATMEAVPVEQLDANEIATRLSETQAKLNGTPNLSPLQRAETEIILEVYQAMTAALTALPK